MAGIVLVQKIVGALAETGASIDRCESMALFLGTRLVTLAASLGHVHVPGTSQVQHSKVLGIDEIELGNGIHNEPVIIFTSPASICMVTLTKHLLLAGLPNRKTYSFGRGSLCQDDRCPNRYRRCRSVFCRFPS
jgi:dihydroxyacetone kinase